MRQLPFLYRVYAHYNRCVERTGVDRGRIFFFRLIRDIHRLLRRDPIVGLRIHSMPLFVDLRDQQTFMAIDHLRFDFGSDSFLRKLLGEGDTFVDVGASLGSYSVLGATLVGREGAVVALEPQERLADLARRSLDLAHGGQHEVHAVACSDAPDELELYIPGISRHGSGWAGLYPRHSAKSGYSALKVRAVTLDSVLDTRTIKGRLVIKIDVEGAEPRVLRGARNTIERYKPIVLFEINPLSAVAAGWQPEEILTLLSELGYGSIAECDSYPQSVPIAAVTQLIDPDRPERHRDLIAIPAVGNAVERGADRAVPRE